MFVSKKSKFILTYLIGIGLLFCLPGCFDQKMHIANNISPSSGHLNTQQEATDKIVEFIPTEAEKSDITKWKRPEDVVIDSGYGDGAALWMMGCWHQTGDKGLPLNVHMADNYYSQSASVGFAPALYELFQKYIRDEGNVFLGLVYINLTISFGHAEFIPYYYCQRDIVMKEDKKIGQLLLNEIERIAFKKRALIFKNQKLVIDGKNNNKSCFFSIKKITDDDYQYDKDYWVDVANDRIVALDSSEIKEKDKIYLNRLHSAYYQLFKSVEMFDSINIKESDENNMDEFRDSFCQTLAPYAEKLEKITNEMKNDSYSDSEIELLDKYASSNAKKNRKFMYKIKTEGNEAKKDAIAYKLESETPC